MFKFKKRNSIKSLNIYYLVFYVGWIKRIQHCKLQIVNDIKKLLDQINPFANIYRMICDRLHENHATDLKLRIIGKKGHDGRRYNLPVASEVAALIVGDFDTVGVERDIIVETRTGSLKRISVLSSAYLPLQYPLLFPRGEDGYRDDIPLNDDSGGESRKRQKVTMREFFAYRIQQRVIEQSPLLYSRHLFQQFLVDVYSMIESSRLQYIRSHQKELRSDMYKGITKAILRGETNASTTGK